MLAGSEVKRRTRAVNGADSIAFRLVNETPSISLFFPLFNEEQNVLQTTADAVRALEDLGAEFEVILVDDGSTDDTRRLAEGLISVDPRIRTVSHPENRGYGAALRTGFNESKYDVVVFADGDGQFDLSEIGNLLAELPGNDAVIGYRIRRADRWHRTLNARAWSALVGVLFGVWPKDLDCGFKLFRREAIQSLELQSDGAFISTELLAKLNRAGFRVAQAGVHHYPRTAGTSTGSNPVVILRAFYELARFWREPR